MKIKLIACFAIAALVGIACVLGLPRTDDASPSASRTNELPIPQKLETITPEFSTQFYIETYERGYSRLHVEGEGDYVLVPHNEEPTDLGIEGARVLRLPCDSVYVAASSAMDLIARLDSLQSVCATSTKADDFVNPEVVERVKSGSIRYVGKYNAPDYEALVGLNADLALVSTMIYHTPKTKEQLENLGIPVFVERANYENEPLGRLEWIKAYGALLGKEDAANAYFENERAKVDSVVAKIAANPPSVKKRVAFFYVSSNGYVNVRKPGDYLCKTIEIAGGEYALDPIGRSDENSLSTININWEDFYRLAVDADYLVYNGAVDSDVRSIDDLVAKNAVFKEFKAVKEGNVWRADTSVYQETSKTAETILGFYAMLNDLDAQRAECLERLK